MADGFSIDPTVSRTLYPQRQETPYRVGEMFLAGRQQRLEEARLDFLRDQAQIENKINNQKLRIAKGQLEVNQLVGIAQLLNAHNSKTMLNIQLQEAVQKEQDRQDMLADRETLNNWSTKANRVVAAGEPPPSDIPNFLTEWGVKQYTSLNSVLAGSYRAKQVELARASAIKNEGELISELRSRPSDASSDLLDEYYATKAENPAGLMPSDWIRRASTAMRSTAEAPSHPDAKLAFELGQLEKHANIAEEQGNTEEAERLRKTVAFADQMAKAGTDAQKRMFLQQLIAPLMQRFEVEGWTAAELDFEIRSAAKSMGIDPVKLESVTPFTPRRNIPRGTASDFFKQNNPPLGAFQFPNQEPIQFGTNILDPMSIWDDLQ